MIRTFDDPILHQPCVRISNGIEAENVYRDMVRVLQSHDNGVGLAAPQAGHSRRMIILWPDRKHPPREMVNPELVWRGTSTKVLPEGCLSFPGVTARVKRWTSIRVKFHRMGEAKPVEQGFHGWHARIVQHELDHLDGICKVGDAWRDARPTAKDQPQ